jgi:CxxC motif-containing protein (DUF1111 family)
MPSLPLRLSALFLALGLSACDDAPRLPRPSPVKPARRQATVRKTDQNAFSLPSANLPPSGAWTSVSATVSSAAPG